MSTGSASKQQSKHQAGFNIQERSNGPSFLSDSHSLHSTHSTALIFVAIYLTTTNSPYISIPCTFKAMDLLSAANAFPLFWSRLKPLLQGIDTVREKPSCCFTLRLAANGATPIRNLRLYLTYWWEGAKGYWWQRRCFYTFMRWTLLSSDNIMGPKANQRTANPKRTKNKECFVRYTKTKEIDINISSVRHLRLWCEVQGSRIWQLGRMLESWVPMTDVPSTQETHLFIHRSVPLAIRLFHHSLTFPTQSSS